MAWDSGGGDGIAKASSQSTSFSNAMGAASLFGSFTSIASAFAQSSAIKAQGEYMEKMYAINAKYAEMAGEDAIKRGEEEVANVQREGRQAVGAQRVALAAQGIDVDYGSAAQTQMDSREAIMTDSLRVRTNAWREAWGYKVQAANYSAQGQWARVGGESKGASTLISGLTDATGYGLKSYAYFKSGGKS